MPLSCGILVLAFGTAIAALADRPLTAEEQQRANHLYTLFVAPCCWRQSVAVHQSAQGMHVRNEIDQDVVAGKSDAAVKAALIREYGHGILMDPEGTRGVLVYTVPMLALGMGLLFALGWIRRARESGSRFRDLFEYDGRRSSRLSGLETETAGSSAFRKD